jgi:hypothetical protein
MRAVLGRVGSAFGRLWSSMAPEAPRQQSDLPPEIWFPSVFSYRAP